MPGGTANPDRANRDARVALDLGDSPRVGTCGCCRGVRVTRSGLRQADPGRSAWWLAAPFAGTVLGVAGPWLADLDGIVVVMGGVVGTGVGVVVSLASPVREWIAQRASDNRVAWMAGAGHTLSGRSLDSLRVHESDRDVRHFAPRDTLPVVRDLLVRREPVLLEGVSMAGKTRLAIETLRDGGWDEGPLWFPMDDNAIADLIESGQDPVAGSVVFLDDADRFLSNASLTLTVLDKWVGDGCVVIATMTTAKYAQWRDDAVSKLVGWDVLNRFTRVHVPGRPTPGELAAMRGTPYADLVDEAERFGLPALLGGAPAARAKYNQGAEDRSWGWALVRAAVDWRRVGLGPARPQQLQSVARAYPDAPVQEVDWTEAWAWATKPFNHSVALLTEVTQKRWEANDVVVDWTASERVAAIVVRAIADANLTPAQSVTLAIRLYATDHLEPSHLVTELLERGLTSTDASVERRAALILAGLRLDEKIADERTEWLLGRGIEVSDLEDHVRLSLEARLRWLRGEDDRAQDLYERAITADPTNANNLGNYARVQFILGIDEPGEQNALRALDD